MKGTKGSFHIFYTKNPFTVLYLHFHTGDAVLYTNWMAGRKSTTGHNNEDCAFVKTQMNGEWDDAECGTNAFLLSQTGEQHPYVCEFQ